MKETNASLICPECDAEYPLDGVDIGGIALIPVPIHRKGKFVDKSDPKNSMILAESLHEPDTCSGSEKLVRVARMARMAR